MEIEGHPTHDMLVELEQRGATLLPGSTSGPDAASLKFLQERAGTSAGTWLFLPPAVYETGFDEVPG